jgi:hypothetical protein
MDELKEIRDRNNNAFYRDDEEIDYLLDALEEAQTKIKELELKVNWQYDAESNLHYCPVCNLTRNKSIVVQVQEGLDRERVLREALQEFCTRVEKGEIRSRKTYSQFMQILRGDKSECIAREALGQEGK